MPIFHLFFNSSLFFPIYSQEPPVLSDNLWGSSDNYTRNTTFVIKTHHILHEKFNHVSQAKRFELTGTTSKILPKK